MWSWQSRAMLIWGKGWAALVARKHGNINQVS